MKISLTARDFDAYFDELKAKAILEFQSWTKFSESNVGVLLLELMSAIADQNSFYLNRAINETFLPTVTRRRNAMKILSRMGYKLGGRKAASVDITFTLSVPHDKSIVIPEGFVCKTADGKYQFPTTKAVSIPTGSICITVPAKNYTTRTDSLSFDGTAGQTKLLIEPQYIEETVSLSINGETWNIVDDLLNSDGTSKHYKVEIDEDERAVLVFGDGINGMCPNSLGKAAYKTGGGKEGNDVETNTITKYAEAITDVAGSTVEISVTNPQSPSGGEDEESLEEARKKAPRARKIVSITVSRDQYERHAEEVSGVARVLALCKKDNSSIPENRTYLYIVPEGGGVPSSELKEAVRYHLEKVKPIVMSTFIDVINGVYKPVTIEGSVEKKEQFLASDVKAAIDAALMKYFGFGTLDENNEYTINFGFYKDKLYVSEITNVILNTTINGAKCVKPNVTLTSPIGQFISIAQNEIPALQSLSGLTVV